MSRNAYSRSGVFKLPLFALGILLAALFVDSTSINRHGIQAPLPRQRASGHFSRSLAQLTPNSAINTPVKVVVHTYWGKESCFNAQVRLNCSMEDTGLSIKHKIAAETGVPVSMQKLYISDSVLTLNSRAPFGDRDRVAEYQSLLRLRHDTKELQLNVFLDLPAPLCHKLKADPQRKGEYVEALRRYSSLLSKVKEARKDPKVLLDPPPPPPPEEYKGTIMPTTDQPIAHDSPSTDTQKGKFILPNYRLHLLFFHDMPHCQNTVKEHLFSWFNRHFPIDWMGNFKFALMCYVIRETCENEPWVKDLLLYTPSIALFCQTRPGKLLWRSIFHLMPTQLIPSVITNVLPAQIAQQLA